MPGERELYHNVPGRTPEKEEWHKVGHTRETENESAWVSCLHIVDFALHLNFTHPILSDSSIPPAIELH